MKKMKICALLLAVTLATGLVGCSQKPAASDATSSAASASGTDTATKPQKITFVLDYTPNTNHTGLYVAQQQGLFEQAGLDVEIVQPPEDGAVALVGAGKAQFGVSFQEVIAPALASDSPIPIVAVAAIINHNTSGILSVKDKGIDSFKNMEGKTYATWQIPLEQAVLRDVIESDGGDFSKLEQIPSTVTDAVSAIQTNIDCLWVYEAWDVMAAKLAGVDYNYISFRDAVPVLDFYTPIIIANEDYLKANPDTAKTLMSVIAQGYEFAIENPDEAAKLLCEAIPELPPDLIAESQQFLAKAYKAEGDKWGYIDEGRWASFYDWCFEKGLIEKQLGKTGFTNAYLP